MNKLNYTSLKQVGTDTEAMYVDKIKCCQIHLTL